MTLFTTIVALSMATAAASASAATGTTSNVRARVSTWESSLPLSGTSRSVFCVCVYVCDVCMVCVCTVHTHTHTRHAFTPPTFLIITYSLFRCTKAKFPSGAHWRTTYPFDCARQRHHQQHTLSPHTNCHPSDIVNLYSTSSLVPPTLCAI